MKQVELEEAWAADLEKRIIQRRTTRDRAVTRWAQARARKAEARVAQTEAAADYQKFLKTRARIRMSQKQQQLQALDHGITVEETGPPDIVRDIQWVYDHLGELFETTDLGIRVFDKEVLMKAPSNGAIAFANYALLDQKAFFDKYVTRLIPKDAANQEEEEQSKEDLMAELDPSFEDMKEFWNMDVAQ
jgi:hypothetical protein